MSRHTEAGFSLTELMIAMTLTSVVVGTALTGFRSMSEAAEGAGLMTDLNINLRSTLNLMTRDLLAAGRGIPVGGVPVPSGTGVLALYRPGPFANMTYPAGQITMPAVSTGNEIGPAVGDDLTTAQREGALTDVISVLFDDISLDLAANPLVDIDQAGRWAIVHPGTVISTQPDGIRAGDLILFTNQNGNALMMVTGRVGQTMQFAAGDPMRLNQVTAPAGTIRSLRNPNGTYPETNATRVQMVSYYIDDTDRARPRMMRRVNMFEPRPIGVVIDDLQLRYDLADGDIDVVDTTSPNQIRKVTVFLAGRSHTPWRRTRQFLRTSVRSQVSLRSLAFMDRYQ
jgi:prepilin-type N-terminal cleavage/methylation domain-containing protein